MITDDEDLYESYYVEGSGVEEVEDYYEYGSGQAGQTEEEFSTSTTTASPATAAPTTTETPAEVHREVSILEQQEIR
jgi:hypothetical protein